MSTPEASDENPSRALIQISDLLGIQRPATELVRAVVRGIGNVFEPILQQWRASADIRIFEKWQQKLQNCEDLPSSFELSLGDRSAIRVRVQESWRQLNRERIAIEAIAEARQQISPQTSQRTTPIDDDWIDRFWRVAQDVSDFDMQAVWGRILSRHTTGVQKYSIKALDTISLLSRSDALRLEQIAKFVGSHADYKSNKDKSGLIFRLAEFKFSAGIEISESNRESIRDLNNILRNSIGDYDSDIFGPLGIYIESGWSYSFRLPRINECARLTIAGKVLLLSGFGHQYDKNYHTESYSNIAGGIQLSAVGKEIFSLIKAEADSSYLQEIQRGLALQGLSVRTFPAPSTEPP